MSTVTEEQPAPSRRRGRYPRQFRRDAAALVIDQHRTIADVAGELGATPATRHAATTAAATTSTTSAPSA